MRRFSLVAAIAIFFVVIMFCSGALAQTEKSIENPLDISKYQSQIAEMGIPTDEAVRQIADKAQALFNEGDYEKALPVLQEWARKANWLANIVAAGLEPFYSASYDDRKNFPYQRISLLVPFENTANDLKTQRNHALIMQAECLVHLNRADEAMGIYMRVLDLIQVKDWDWWLRAANGLYKLVGIPSIAKESE